MRHCVICLLSLSFLALCGSAAGAAERKTISVLTSFTVLADMTKNIGGDAITVKSLVGPNGDVHAFEPTPSDAKALNQASLVVVNGLALEGWVERLIKTSGYKGPLCVASKGATLRDREDEHDAKATKDEKHTDKREATDPHAWQSLANGLVYVDNIAAALVAVDPANAAHYKQNTEAYNAKLAELDAWAKAEFAAIPKAQRRMITSHDALGYFGAAYDVDILSPVGFSTDSEPSAGQVAKLIRQIRKEKISAVFIENVSDPRLIEQIAKESGTTMGGELYSDALSKPDGPAPTYIDMFKNNVAKIIAAMRK